jgi:hypothetical protein
MPQLERRTPGGSETVSVSRSAALDWFTIRDGTDRATVDAAHRAVLQIRRPRIEDGTVDLNSDARWPEHVRWAVGEAGQREMRTRSFLGRSWTRRTASIDLDPADDRDFEIAMALVPYTIGSTGIDHEQRIIWDTNDTGTSAAFQLTAAEAAQVRSLIGEEGADPATLVSLSRDGDVYS